MIHTLDPKPVLRLLPLGVAGAIVAYLLVRDAGALGVVVAAATLGCAGLLVARLRATEAEQDLALIGRVAQAALLLTPGIGIVGFAFNAGAYFPETVALGVLVLAAVLVIRMAVARDAFHGFGAPLAIAAGALALFALWTLASAAWSHAPARALIEFDRVLLYLLALVTFGLVGRHPRRLRLMLYGVALGIVIVCGFAFVSRVAPDVWSAPSEFQNNRLSYPVTYWNALGLLAGLGIVLALHLTTDLREPRWLRVASAATVPMLGATILLTFSRGGIGACILGLAAYLLLGRPRGLVTGLVAVAPLTVVAVRAAYDATLLATTTYTQPAAVAQGHHLARVVILCAAGAALLRMVLLLVDGRLDRFRLPPRVRRPAVAGGWLALVVAAVVVGLALDVPGFAHDQYHRFVAHRGVKQAQVRDRLTDPASNGRIDHWRVSVHQFRKAPSTGQGEGTFAVAWNRQRPFEVPVVNAHSLYVEVLGELGLVGLAALVLAIAALLVALAPIGRGPDRAIYAALFAAALVWAVHAGFDWDWEMPVVTGWIFAAGGLALGRRATAPPIPARDAIRGIVGLGCVLVAVIPALILTSQRSIDDASAAFRDGDCATTLADARDARSALDLRPEPYQLTALCQLRARQWTPGITTLKRALARDPDDWELHYVLAWGQAAAGLDPRAEALRAWRLNRLDPSANMLFRFVRSARPAGWRRHGQILARTVPLYFQQ